MFLNSYKIIDKIGFSGIHIFQYSDRENTIASRLENKVDPKIKKERADRLEHLKKIMAHREREKYIGKELDVLVEEKIGNFLFGYSENYLRVKFKGDESLLNRIQRVTINTIEKEMLLAYE